MKKILLIALAVALAISLGSGCNNSRRVADDLDDDLGPIVIGGTSDDDSGDKPDDNDKPDDKLDDNTGDLPDDNSGDKPDVDEPVIDIPEGWPVDILPPGFLVYPNGEVDDLSGEDYIFIVIHYTDQNTFEEYMTELEAWGFEFSALGTDGMYTGITDGWELGLSSTETMVGINLKPIN